ncbi:hypothetical protein [Nemorincola caseinilytica]|uniref:hypothetical protein n=1 Tax=Nemorincola caseinilytica TaxID=2054315 RepID=UPI0031F000C9
MNATTLVAGHLNTAWIGDVYVDAIGNGNEDPYVFHDPWLYSYCHASQLRRNIRPDSFLQKGSVMIFVSGQEANNDRLTIDTFFVVGDIQKWNGQDSPELPAKFSDHHNNSGSALWQRHFKFPFEGSHIRVSHTYEAEQWVYGKELFSFLPLSANGGRTTIQFDNIDVALRNKIKSKVKGKYPVLLEDADLKILTALIETNTVTKVLKDIVFLSARPRL